MNRMLLVVATVVLAAGCGRRQQAEAEEPVGATQLPATRTAPTTGATVATKVQAEPERTPELTAADLAKSGSKYVEQVVRVKGAGDMQYPKLRTGGGPSGNLPPHPVMVMQGKAGRVVIEMAGYPNPGDIPPDPFVIEGRVTESSGGVVKMRFGEFVK